MVKFKKLCCPLCDWESGLIVVTDDPYAWSTWYRHVGKEHGIKPTVVDLD